MMSTNAWAAKASISIVKVSRGSRVGAIAATTKNPRAKAVSTAVLTFASEVALNPMNAPATNASNSAENFASLSSATNRSVEFWSTFSGSDRQPCEHSSGHSERSDEGWQYVNHDVSSESILKV